MNKIKVLLGLVTILTSCSGGGSDSNVSIEGTLRQSGVAVHLDARSIENQRHGAGEPIEDVEVCALGRCATTDPEGRWGFGINDDQVGQDIEFSIVGHFIDSRVSIFIPANIVSAEISLLNRDNQPSVSALSVIDTEGELNSIIK